MDLLKQFLQPEIIWFLIGLLLMLIELVLPGLIVFFFGVGACITALCCIIFQNLPLNAQLIIFIISSLLCLVALRRWLKNIFIGHSEEKEIEQQIQSEYVGKFAQVTENIPANGFGKIEFQGSDWKATADEQIEAGSDVKIVSQENLVLKVKKP